MKSKTQVWQLIKSMKIKDITIHDMAYVKFHYEHINGIITTTTAYTAKTKETLGIK